MVYNYCINITYGGYNMKKNFFKTYLFYGIIVILIGSLLQLYVIKLNSNDWFNLIVSVLANSCLTAGVGLIIGYVMDLTKNSNEYINYIQDRLQETVVSHKFIANLSEDERLKLVESCLSKNSTNKMQSEYIRYKAQKISKLCEGHLRSDIDYITTAKIKDNKIVLHTVMRYKIFKVNGSYQKIRHLFKNPMGKITSLKITNSKKEVYTFPDTQLVTTPITQNQNENELAYSNVVEIPSHLKGENCLSITSVVEEYGYDHWAYLEWMSLYPTEGISYKIICEDGLIIKERMIFDDQRGLYSVHFEKNAQDQITQYTISCDEWTDPYTGFSLIIAKP